MKIAIMQPYLFPYIGYFQLIEAVDQFVICDNYQYTRHGWISRNRYLQNGKDAFFSLQIKGDSQTKNICERELAADFKADKILNQLKDAYKKSPHFEQTMDLVESVLEYPDRNLFRFLENSINQACTRLGITRQISKTSEISIDHSLKKEERVIALCSAMGADVYVNAIGGREVYSAENFSNKNIELKFLESKSLTYQQFGGTFVPSLSIIDVMMFNPINVIKRWLEFDYEMV
ncbi:MAG: hypothetical protein EBR81_01690 [Proteobacteria bacterium]|nr:hypothetical protein [Pseudomonadota bacterium]